MEIRDKDSYGIARVLIEQSDSNYNYILWCTDTRECAVIDPCDARTILEIVQRLGLRVKYIINTHTHPDHIEGNDAILKVSLQSFDSSSAAKILVHPSRKQHVAPRNEPIDEGDVVEVGALNIRVIHTPGHCPEHISLILDDCIFVGDTIFSAGCGNVRFRGDVDALYDTFANRLTPLPDNLIIHYGHEYTEKNLRFALDIEPLNEAAASKLVVVRAALSKGEYVPLPTLGEEKTYNPFLRVEVPEVIEAVKRKVPEAGHGPRNVFKALRGLRDEWV